MRRIVPRNERQTDNLIKAIVIDRDVTQGVSKASIVGNATPRMAM